jgi:acetolactate synthase-1/2/3 large subunit
MTTTVADIMAATLKAYGATHLFGMKDPIALYHAVRPLGIHAITVRDEKHGAIMAHGFAKATGRPGICTAMCGPAATNLITGLLEALQSSIPVIAFVVEVAAAQKGRHASSDLDHERALAPFAKWVGRIDVPERAGEMVRHAFRIATSGRPGPVVVLCPRDVMGAAAECEVTADPQYVRVPSMRSRGSCEGIAAACELLLGAEQPAIISGGGAILSGAAGDIVELAELCSVPVATTMNGRGAIADSHPLSVGALGTSTGGQYGRGQVANAVVAEADVALILGSRNGQICSYDWTLPRAGTKIVHVDVDAMEIGRNFATTVALLGDVRETVRDIVELCRDRGGRRANEDQLARVARLRAAWLEEIDVVARSQQVPIRPERLLRAISERMNGDDIVVTDASYITGWTFSHVDSHGNGNGVISPRGTGGIGWSLPAAIGAKVAQPDRHVLCLTGDGGFGYVLGELETAARNKINLNVIVFNNATLGFQKHFEEQLLGDGWECDLLEIDHAAVAREMGWQGERVVQPSEIGPALDRARQSGAPYLVDVAIDPEAIAPIVSLTDAGAVLDAH